MASAPQSASLPLFYNELTPLNSRDHAEFKSRSTDKATWRRLPGQLRSARGAPRRCEAAGAALC